MKDNINLMVINARFLKPYDKKMFNEILNLRKPIFVYEESMEIGSLGSLIAKDSIDSQIYSFGVKDAFNFHASREELIKENELDEDSIINKIRNILK